MHYRPEIDGLRGIAIVAVLINHVDRRLLPGGFVGVDVFFVISGYLITSILRRDAAQGVLSLPRFYARRVKRLVPAATVMAAVVSVIGASLLLPAEFKDLGASLVAYAAMASNVLFWRWDDYFAGQERAWPLLHTWSLAVEEQFYLVFPWLILLVTRRSRRFQALVFGCLCVASLALSVWQSHHDPRSAYYLLPSRSWELLAGGLCALVPAAARLPRPVVTGIGWASLGCVLLPMAVLSERTPFPGWAATVPVGGTAGLIVVTVHGDSLIKTLLTSRILVGIGLISYSLYLWHWPLLTLARYPWSGMPGSCPLVVPWVTGLCSIAVAWWSYRFVETPGRRATWPDRKTLFAGAAAALAVVAGGLVIHRSRGLPDRLSPAVVRYAAGVTDFQPRRLDTIDLPLGTIENGAMPRLGVASDTAAPAFVLWGDSHADALVPAFDEAARSRGLSGYALTRGATPPLADVEFDAPGDHPPNWAFRDAALDRIRRDRPPCVILAARWSGLLHRDLRLKPDGGIAPSHHGAMLAAAVDHTLDELSAAGVKRVWLLGEVPTQRFNVPRQLALHARFGWQDVAPLSAAAFQAETSAATRVLEAATGSGVGFLDLSAVVRRASPEPLLIGDRPMYSDDTHLSATAARAIAPELSAILDPLTSGGGDRSP